jgi:hypothetical protein
MATTTFTSREVARDGLVALFTADGTWQAVYGYVPKATTIDGQWPFLVLTSAGTLQGMAGESYNPTEYTFSAVSFVLMDDNADWNEDDAEDKLDELDQKFRQIIRDNPTAGTFADALMFADNQSRTDYAIVGGVAYRTEEWLITVHLYTGA